MAQAAVLTISDRRSEGKAEDASGPEARRMIEAMGLSVADPFIVPDDISLIRDQVKKLAGTFELIVTTGGTGIGPRDVTPEAVEPLFDRALPGFGEMMRCGTFVKTPLSIVSRGGAGLIGRTLVVMLPGSPKAVRECLEVVGPAMRHAVKVLGGAPMDCAREATK